MRSISTLQPFKIGLWGSNRGLGEERNFCDGFTWQATVGRSHPWRNSLFGSHLCNTSLGI